MRRPIHSIKVARLDPKPLLGRVPARSSQRLEVNSLHLSPAHTARLFFALAR